MKNGVVLVLVPIGFTAISCKTSILVKPSSSGTEEALGSFRKTLFDQRLVIHTCLPHHDLDLVRLTG
jgi:hypothetical protein